MESLQNVEIKNQQIVLDQLAELAARDGEIAVLWLYGSRATGDAQANSDFDLAVAFSTRDGSAWEQRLRSETLALDWAAALGLPSSQVSVVDINSAPAHLAMSIMGADRALHVSDPLRLAREENRISSVWEIDHLYHQRQAGSE
ncbi:MAG: nucleotidyltransferase domain-containing protein [Chromatocurvus sp.]